MVQAKEEILKSAGIDAENALVDFYVRRKNGTWETLNLSEADGADVEEASNVTICVLLTSRFNILCYF